MPKISELNYPNAVTADGRRKSWFIVALTHNGDIYCGPCCDAMGLSETTPEANPVFADDDYTDMTCGSCGEKIT
jgi:hypothetical protein